MLQNTPKVYSKEFYKRLTANTRRLSKRDNQTKAKRRGAACYGMDQERYFTESQCGEPYGLTEYVNNYGKNDPTEMQLQRFEQTYCYLLVPQTTRRAIEDLTYYLMHNRRTGQWFARRRYTNLMEMEMHMKRYKNNTLRYPIYDQPRTHKDLPRIHIYDKEDEATKDLAGHSMIRILATYTERYTKSTAFLYHFNIMYDGDTIRKRLT
eukprot:4444677-Amphidinium_carterae.2